MTDTPPGTIHTLGTLRAEQGKGIVRVEARFLTTIDDLWSALTSPSRLAHWLGQVEGDLHPAYLRLAAAIT